MKKITLLLTLGTSLVSFNLRQPEEISEQDEINLLLDNWHRAAAIADANTYFGLMADDAIYVGTDATEHWTKSEFQAFAKPYFDRGNAWDFKPLTRHVYFSKDRKTAWFDETLDTWMKICRGSGVLVKTSGQWKIKHYVLSMTIPNAITKEVITAKSAIENPLLTKMKTKED